MELLIDINNFVSESNVGKDINSPRTLEACLRVGLDPAELYPKSRSSFATKDLTKQMIDIKYNTFEQKRKDKISVVATERQSIISYLDKKNAANNGTITKADGTVVKAEVGESAMLDMELKRMEALKRRQEKEISKIVEKEQAGALLQLKIKRAEDEEEHKRKLYAKKVAEQRAAAEKKAQERVKELKQKEAEEEQKRREVAKKEREFAEKMKVIALANERRIAQEAREKDQERAAKIEAYRQKTEALIQEQAQAAEANRLLMLEREQRVQAQLERKVELKKKEVAEARSKALLRIEEAKEKYNELTVAKKAAYDEKQKEALARAKENAILEREHTKKVIESREKKVKTRYNRLVDAFRIRGDHRQTIIDRRSMKDSSFSKVQEERDQSTSMLKFMTDLKLKDKLENVERIARVNEFKRIQTLRRIEEANNRYETIQSARQALLNKHREEVKNSLIRKHEISDAMELMKITNDFSLLDKIFTQKKSKTHTGGKAEEEEAPDKEEKPVNPAATA